MPFLNRNSNAEINYLVEGSGDLDILLFNGASLNLEFWGSLAQELTAIGRVLRFDQRNAGQTRFEGSFSLNTVAADAATLMKDQGSERVIAIGHAWGGRVAQVFARDYPHLLSKLVICANGGQFPPIDTSVIDQALREARRSGDRSAWESAYEARWCAKGFRDRAPERFQEVADLGWNSRANKAASWDPKVSPSSSYWGTATVPTLLIYGEEDKNGTPKNAEDLHQRIRNSELIMLSNAGHFVIREQEEQVLEAITTFANKK
ncbi:MAG: alpha/beta hydrolase [Pseudomonadales bacterium]